MAKRELVFKVESGKGCAGSYDITVFEDGDPTPLLGSDGQHLPADSTLVQIAEAAVRYADLLVALDTTRDGKWLIGRAEKLPKAKAERAGGK